MFWSSGIDFYNTGVYKWCFANSYSDINTSNLITSMSGEDKKITNSLNCLSTYIDPSADEDAVITLKIVPCLTETPYICEVSY